MSSYDFPVVRPEDESLVPWDASQEHHDLEVQLGVNAGDAETMVARALEETPYFPGAEDRLRLEEVNRWCHAKQMEQLVLFTDAGRVVLNPAAVSALATAARLHASTQTDQKPPA